MNSRLILPEKADLSTYQRPIFDFFSSFGFRRPLDPQCLVSPREFPDVRPDPRVWVEVRALLQLGWLFALLLVTGCHTVLPSNDRHWQPDMAALSTTEFQGNLATVRNIRHCAYRSTTDFDVRYYDQQVDLNQIQTVDLIIVPFGDFPNLAHMMTSFGMSDGTYICVSIEIRRESHESFDPFKGFFNQYELMYVVGDERDLIHLRANYRRDEVYIYRVKATPEQAQRMFVSMMNRANKLAREPEFYNTITNNCTTNVVWHVNELSPNLIRYGSEVLLPAHSPRLAYSLGLIDNPMNKSFEQIHAEARVTEQAYRHREDPDFSNAIRRR